MVVSIDSLYFGSLSLLYSTTFIVINSTGSEVLSNNWIALVSNDRRYVSYGSEIIALKLRKELGSTLLFKVKIAIILELIDVIRLFFLLVKENYKPNMLD